MKKPNGKVKMSVYYVLPLIAILFVVAIVLFVVQPKITEIQTLQQKKAAEEERKEKLDQKLTKLQQLDNNKTELLAQLTALTIALPNQKEAPALIIQLQKMAQESNVDIQGIQLSPGKLINDTVLAANSKTGPSIAFTLSLRGDYEAVKTFMGKVYNSKRLINMESINLSTGNSQDETGGVTVTSNMIAYYQALPPTPKDETDSIPVLSEEDTRIYSLLQTYNSYQIEAGTQNNPTPQPSVQPIIEEEQEASSSAIN